MKISLASLLAIAGAAGCLAAATVPIAAHADDDRLPNFDKIVIVIEENQQEQTIIGNSSAPYTNWLANHGALITNSYGCEHPSQPNYLDLFSGSDQNVYDDNPIPSNPFSGDNLGAELLQHSLTFAGFSEDLPYVGDTTDQIAAAPGDPAGTHDYARKHNPWANWQDDAFVAGPANPGSNYLPSSVNQPLTPFAAIAASGKFNELPTVSIVVPNQQHDDHGVAGGLSGNALFAAGDTWLQQNIAKYAEWAKSHNSLLIVTWDEDDYTAINLIPTIFYGAHVVTGLYDEDLLSFTSLVNDDATPPTAPINPIYQPIVGINHWNVLRTIEDIYHLDHAGASAKVRPITDIFEANDNWWWGW